MTKYTYTKADFERMDFDIVSARYHELDSAFYWNNSPQGHSWWVDAHYNINGNDGSAQRAELQNMVEQYDALYGEVQS